MFRDVGGIITLPRGPLRELLALGAGELPAGWLLVLLGSVAK